MKPFALAVTLLLLAATSSVVFGSPYDSGTYNTRLSWVSLWYSKAVVCPLAELKDWNCASCGDESISSFQVRNVYNNATEKSQSFTGYDPKINAIVLSIRGSENWRNWITDFDFTKIDCPWSGTPSGCQIHRGFWHEWQSMRIGVLGDVRALSMRYPTAFVLATGHSLGASASLIAAIDIAQSLFANSTNAPRMIALNFGEPRAGNAVFAQWAATALAPIGKQFRVTHETDPIPHLPPESFGFVHTWHELWYDNDGNTTYRNCSDTPAKEDPKCSDSVLPIDPFAHLKYLGCGTGCGSCDVSSTKQQRDELEATRAFVRTPEYHRMLGLIKMERKVKELRRRGGMN